MIVIPLVDLRPGWVEFTRTPGVLRILKPGEALKERHRAQGMIFECPRCIERSKNGRAHNCIFLFNMKSVPANARPYARFDPSLYFPSSDLGMPAIPVDFSQMTLAQKSDCPSKPDSLLLKPGDLKCGWEGTVEHGIVAWQPSLIENFKRRLFKK